ncbi:MAG: adenylyl-sulfate kinase [Ignavibacteriae bacterium]|nr:adenylyl-sulfate kinase [Ignavibacteriota bacterium]NOG98619.1 adenylyl-sulfate kinase [Ignavibacteriota bacterium]
MYKETKSRSIVKTISWRILATLTTISLVYIFIGDTTIAFTVGGIEVFLKMLVYFFHERIWDKLNFGRHEIQPFVVWLTGYARSGKSEIGKQLSVMLKEKGLKVEHFDGHSVRDLFPQTGFSRFEVNQHIERVGFLSSKLEKQGVFVIASFLSPYEESREFVRKICKNFVEVYVSTPLEFCEKNDKKGVYAKARKGEIQNFPGINVDYEAPKNPKINVDTSMMTIEQSANKIFNYLKKYI